MKLLAEIIKDSKYSEDINYRSREAARGIVVDDENKIPILFNGMFEYHKLPGGGIDEGETKLEAMYREMKEEAGCEVNVIGEVGKTHEFFSEVDPIEQFSYCFYGKIISKGEQSFTEKELREGFELRWYTLDEAIEHLENDKPKNLMGENIQKRDLTFLKEYKSFNL